MCRDATVPQRPAAGASTGALPEVESSTPERRRRRDAPCDPANGAVKIGREGAYNAPHGPTARSRVRPFVKERACARSSPPRPTASPRTEAAPVPDETLRAAVIGCGMMGRQHALAYQASSGIRLVGVCDLQPIAAERLGRELGAPAFASIDELLAEARPELVSVVTPDAHHLAPTLAVLAGGCHVLVEKPIALELADARRMLEAARAADRVLAVDFNRRFARPHQLARQYQRDGRLGTFAYAALRVALPGGRLPTTPYELVYDSLVHLLDLARWYGGEVAEVTCAMSDRRDDFAYHNVQIGLRFADGGVGSVLGSWDGTRLHPIELAEIQGTGGRARIDNVVSRFTFEPNGSDLAEVWEPRPFGDRRELLQFYPTTVRAHVDAPVLALETSTAPPVSGEDGLRALQLVKAAILAFEERAVVDPRAVE